MSVTRKYSFYAVGVGATVLGGISSQNLRITNTVDKDPKSGLARVRFVALSGQEALASFATEQIATGMGAVSVLGQNIASLSGYLAFYGNQYDDGGTRKSGANHRKYTVYKGLLVPRTLSVSHQGNATLSYEAYAVYDGTHELIVVEDSQALPSGITDAERFTLGPVTVGGVTISEVTQVDIDFGLSVQVTASDSEVRPTFSCITQVAPTVSIRSMDLQAFKSTNIPITGKAGTHANTSVYLRKRANAGSFESDASAVHVKVSANGLCLVDVAQDASQDDASTSLMMHCTYDGSNEPVVCTTNTAIS